MVTVDPSQEILFEVEGQIATITFNRPEAMNAMTWNMYDRLVTYCDELDQRDDIRRRRRQGVRLGNRYQPVPGICQSSGRDRLRTANGEVTGRLERVRKPTIAMIHGVRRRRRQHRACLRLSLRRPEPPLRIPIARTIGNCLSLAGYGRLVDYVGPAKAGIDHAGQATDRRRSPQPRRGD